MPDWLSQIAERWMLKARAEGKLTGLAGEGAPLPDRPGDAFVDPAEAVGFRIMAEAGALPEEIILRKAIAAQKEKLAGLRDPEARKVAMAELARLDLAHSMAREARQKFLKG